VSALRVATALCSAAPTRVAGETALVALVVLTASGLAPTPIGAAQSLVLLSPLATLACAARLRWPEGSLLRRLATEMAVAVVLSLGLALGLLGAAAVLGRPTFPNQPGLGFGGLALGIVFVNAPLYATLRVALWLLTLWNRLRRRRLVWELTHTHLTVLAALLLGVDAVLVLLAIRLGAPPQLVPGQEEPPVALLTRTIAWLLPTQVLVAALLGFVVVLLLPPLALVSHLVARRLTRRLEALASAMTALQAGDPTARVEVDGEDEVALLQASFNRMADELHRTTRALREERDRVASLLLARRHLVASVSHELRTPLATLRAYLESARRRFDREMPPPLRHDLQVMEREVLHLQNLIEDLFTLARADAAQLDLSCHPVDVGAVAQRLVDTVAPVAWKNEQVQVLANVAPDLPLALADERRLEQVLRNLVQNAIRHTPPGGLVVVDVAAEAEALTVRVRDTGEGIAAEHLPHIWERFYRIETDGAPGRAGAGLGLALVKELTEAMNGTVAVASREDEGAQFEVRLPLARDAHERAESAP